MKRDAVSRRIQEGDLELPPLPGAGGEVGEEAAGVGDGRVEEDKLVRGGGVGGLRRAGGSRPPAVHIEPNLRTDAHALRREKFRRPSRTLSRLADGEFRED